MNKRKPVGIGLIGAGRIGSSHAAIIANRLPQANLVAIADPAYDVADKLAKTLNCPTAYTDAKALIADPAVEAVIIATPARLHSNMVELAANAGKAIFCEKPMALTLAEADRAIAAAKSNSVPLQVGFNRRWDQAFLEGFEAISAGKIGTPQLLRSLTRDPGPF